MKIFAIILIVFLGICTLWTAHESDLKDARIRELEREVRELKLDKRADSIVNCRISEFRASTRP